MKRFALCSLLFTFVLTATEHDRDMVPYAEKIIEERLGDICGPDVRQLRRQLLNLNAVLTLENANYDDGVDAMLPDLTGADVESADNIQTLAAELVRKAYDGGVTHLPQYFVETLQDIETLTRRLTNGEKGAAFLFEKEIPYVPDI